MMASVVSNARRQSPRNQKGKITYEHLAVLCEEAVALDYDLSDAVCNKHRHEDTACEWQVYLHKRRKESVLVHGKEKNYRVPNYYAHCVAYPKKEYNLISEWHELRPSDQTTLRVNGQQIVVFPKACALQEIYQWLNIKGLQSTSKKVTSWRTEIRENFETTALTRLSAMYSPNRPSFKSSMLRQVVKEAVISRGLLNDMFLDLYIKCWHPAVSLVTFHIHLLYISYTFHIHLSYI